MESALNASVIFFGSVREMIQKAMEAIGKIPKVGEWAGLSGFKAQTYADIRADVSDDLSDMVTAALGMGKVELINVDAEKTASSRGLVCGGSHL